MCIILNMSTTNPTIQDEIRYWEAELATAPAAERAQREAALEGLYRIADMDEDEFRGAPLWGPADPD